MCTKYITVDPPAHIVVLPFLHGSGALGCLSYGTTSRSTLSWSKQRKRSKEKKEEYLKEDKTTSITSRATDTTKGVLSKERKERPEKKIKGLHYLLDKNNYIEFTLKYNGGVWRNQTKG